jgi:hypothetical protein
MNNQIANEMSSNAIQSVVVVKTKRPYIRKLKVANDEKIVEVVNIVNDVDKIPEPVEELVADEEEEDADSSVADEEADDTNDDDEEMLIVAVARVETAVEKLKRQRAEMDLEIQKAEEEEHRKSQVGAYRIKIVASYKEELETAIAKQTYYNSKIEKLTGELEAVENYVDEELLEVIMESDKLKGICIPVKSSGKVVKVGGASGRKTPTNKGDIRVPSKIFKHREVIRHQTAISTWEATYDKLKDEFVITKITGIDGKQPVLKKTELYSLKVKGAEDDEGKIVRVGVERVKNPNQFIVAHNSQECPTAVQKQAPWSGNTQLFRDGDWISIGNLPVLNA